MLLSPTVSRMITGHALVAVLVVPGDPCHQLLSFDAAFCSRLLLEVFCIVASQSGCQTPTVEDLDFAVLSDSVSEPEIGGFRGFLHFGVLGVGKVLPCEA